MVSEWELIITLIGHVIWPLTTLVVLFVFRNPLVAILENLTERIKDKSQAVELSKDGLKILPQQVAAMESTNAAQKDRLDHLTAAVTRLNDAISNSDIEKVSPTKIPDELIKLAHEYMGVNIPEYSARVREKERLTSELGSAVLRLKVPKDVLADSADEGLRLALAAAILIQPETGDFQRLIRASKGINRLHIRFKMVLALSQLIESLYVLVCDREEAAGMLFAFEHGADTPLLTLIQQTKALLMIRSSEYKEYL